MNITETLALADGTKVYNETTEQTYYVWSGGLYLDSSYDTLVNLSYDLLDGFELAPVIDGETLSALISAWNGSMPDGGRSVSPDLMAPNSARFKRFLDLLNNSGVF